MTRIIDIVYSPDDGGYYAEEWDFERDKRRMTKRIYSSEAAVRKAIKSDRAWEAWK